VDVYWLWLTGLKGVGPVNKSENPVGIRDFLDLFDGNLKALISHLCSMEIEGQLMISGQTVRGVAGSGVAGSDPKAIF